MRSARSFQPSLGASSPRTKKFTLNNLGALRENLQTVGGFLSAIGESEENAAGLLWRNVDPDLVISMLQAYNGHDDDNSFTTVDIVRHINNRLGAGELGSWSVGLIDNSTGKEEAPFVEYGFNHRFGLSTRSRLLGRETIGELMQPIHFAMDLPGELAEYRDGVSFSYAKMYAARKPSNPLLLSTPSTRIQQFLNSLASQENLFPEHLEKEHGLVWPLHFQKPLNHLKNVPIKQENFGLWEVLGMILVKTCMMLLTKSRISLLFPIHTLKKGC